MRHCTFLFIPKCEINRCFFSPPSRLSCLISLGSWFFQPFLLSYPHFYTRWRTFCRSRAHRRHAQFSLNSFLASAHNFILHNIRYLQSGMATAQCVSKPSQLWVYISVAFSQPSLNPQVSIDMHAPGWISSNIWHTYISLFWSNCPSAIYILWYKWKINQQKYMFFLFRQNTHRISNKSHHNLCPRAKIKFPL